MTRSLQPPEMIARQPANARPRVGFLNLLRHHRFSLCAAGLVVSLAGNVAGFLVLTKLHADALTAAVFPSRGQEIFRLHPVPARKAGTRIVLFGDSRIAQWTNFPVREGSELVMRGVPGGTTAQMRLRFAGDVLDADPDIVVLQLGINDLVAIGVLPDRQSEIVRQCEANMRYFVEALRERNIRTILLTIIPPADPPFWRRPFWSEDISAEAEKLNRQWLSATVSPGLHVVDTRAILQDNHGHWIDGVTADALHLTSRGYDQLNTAILPLLRD
jgi:lysophospholipase L1-like esterase